ncbi:MAG TPA: hypothetical protein ENI61_04520 [Ignavibacteria bacterium]|nr:hypothetical protein [Ignavibacteria bacterium]
MAGWVPRIKLWSSDGSTELYTFPLVQNHNAPQTGKKLIRKTNFRSQGEIIIEGGETPWEVTINFILTGSEYLDIASAIETLESKVPLNTAFLLKINTTASNYFGGANGYKIKRLLPILYPNRNKDLMNTKQDVTIKLQVNSW